VTRACGHLVLEPCNVSGALSCTRKWMRWLPQRANLPSAVYSQRRTEFLRPSVNQCRQRLWRGPKLNTATITASARTTVTLRADILPCPPPRPPSTLGPGDRWQVFWRVTVTAAKQCVLRIPHCALQSTALPGKTVFRLHPSAVTRGTNPPATRTLFGCRRRRADPFLTAITRRKLA